MNSIGIASFVQANKKKKKKKKNDATPIVGFVSIHGSPIVYRPELAQSQKNGVSKRCSGYRFSFE
jgi:hypothetical protein